MATVSVKGYQTQNVISWLHSIIRTVFTCGVHGCAGQLDVKERGDSWGYGRTVTDGCMTTHVERGCPRGSR